MTTAQQTDWPIQQVARLAGTTSRALRHYDDIGLLAPSRTGVNGYRYYDRDALVRLQRILLLRHLGLGLQTIAEVLDREQDAHRALTAHLHWLRQERDRLSRQAASVESTINAMRGDEQIMATDMLDGFDHTAYRQEVEERWGSDAYAAGDAWWRSKSPADKQELQRRHLDIARDHAAAKAAGQSPAGATVQRIAQRHYDWIGAAPRAASGAISSGYFLGLGEMYVPDPRFARNYGGRAGAEFVRDAMSAYAEANL